jgi:Tfp pilus assembly protein PilV
MLRGREFTIHAVVGALALAPMQAAHANYTERDARRSCEVYIGSNYGLWNTDDVSVETKGNHDYKVRGRVKTNNGNHRKFVCKIRHKEVVSAKIDGERRGNDKHDNNHHHNDDSNATAAAIGVGVLGLALAAAAMSNDDSDKNHNQSQNHENQPHRWQDNGGDPFDDRDQLRKACKHELNRHLKAEHGDVDRIEMQNSHLDGRDLMGDAEVHWRHGGRAELHYTCNFDRQGNVHDGRYRYYSQ